MKKHCLTKSYKGLIFISVIVRAPTNRSHALFQAKQKAERNRQKVEESFLKASHAQRQEAAQQRREDKRRAEKERIMNEEDPDKQRKWEVSSTWDLSQPHIHKGVCV